MVGPLFWSAVSGGRGAGSAMTTADSTLATGWKGRALRHPEAHGKRWAALGVLYQQSAESFGRLGDYLRNRGRKRHERRRGSEWILATRQISAQAHACLFSS